MKYGKVVDKKLNSSVWMSKDFPVKLQHLYPLIDLLSSVSANFEQLKNFIYNGLPKQTGELFPVKVAIPIMFGLNAVIYFENFELG